MILLSVALVTLAIKGYPKTGTALKVYAVELAAGAISLEQHSKFVIADVVGQTILRVFSELVQYAISQTRSSVLVQK